MLNSALTGRSHRSHDGRERLREAIERTKSVLKLPPGYEIAIVPGSDTGAFEMAMWNLLGARGVDVFAWDVFGRIWLRDAVDILRLQDVRTFDAEWGRLPDLSQADFTRDVIFTWNGTTSGVSVPDAEWIASDRTGLTFCDATSALFAQNINFEKIDVLTFSWQKVLGGEGAHGMLVLSPRAFERLGSYTPKWPVAKIMSLKNRNGIVRDVFEGVTINTPSMLCVEDYLDALRWVERIGGLSGTISRAKRNAAVIYDWAGRTAWLAPLAAEAASRSVTSVCLKFCDSEFENRDETARLAFLKSLTNLLESEQVAFDINAYRGVPAGLRIWTGATIENDDLIALTKWLDWAYAETKGARVA